MIHVQPKSNALITLLFKDLVCLNSLKAQNRSERKETPETLSMGILDQLGLSASTETASNSIDDSERRQRAHAAPLNRNLQNDFDFLINPKEKLELEESYSPFPLFPVAPSRWARSTSSRRTRRSSA